METLGGVVVSYCRSTALRRLPSPNLSLSPVPQLARSAREDRPDCDRRPGEVDR